MTAIADNKKKVVLPTAKPGDRFDVEVSGEGFLLGSSSQSSEGRLRSDSRSEAGS
jgi:hypothetical protein